MRDGRRGAAARGPRKFPPYTTPRRARADQSRLITTWSAEDVRSGGVGLDQPGRRQSMRMALDLSFGFNVGTNSSALERPEQDWNRGPVRGRNQDTEMIEVLTPRRPVCAMCCLLIQASCLASCTSEHACERASEGQGGRELAQVGGWERRTGHRLSTSLTLQVTY